MSLASAKSGQPAATAQTATQTVSPGWCGMHPTVQEVLHSVPTGTTTWVHGWVRSCRRSKHVGFLSIADGSGATPVQAVVNAEQAEAMALLPSIGTGASVRAHGTVVDSHKAGQARELHVDTLEMLAPADPQTYPLQKKGHTLEFLRSIAHLRPRSNTFGAIFRLRSALAQATHAFFAAHAFAYVHTPIITASDCEGAGEMFEVTTKSKGDMFFGRPAYLTVSGQLGGEALSYGLGRIYTFGPTFRAENSNTVRHLSEFWMIEPEMAFCNLAQNSAVAQSYLRHTIEHVLEHCGDDLQFLADHYDKSLLQTLQDTVAAPFAQVTYTEAVELLAGANRPFAQTPSWGCDLQTEHERFLVEEYFRKPVVVTNYPRAIKAFYMYQNDDARTVAAMDILVPRIGEIIGGSQREHRLPKLMERLEALQMPQAHYQWYLDLGRFGAVEHAGFGLGFERLVMFCTGMTNIRDVIPFPRAPGSAAY